MMTSDERLIFDLFKEYAFKVIQEPKFKCKYSFVEPGLAYKNTLWDWDSFYEIYALNDIVEILKDDQDFDYEYYRKKVNEAAKGNVLNFLDLQEEDGYTPIMMRADVYDDDYCKRPNVKNTGKGYLIKAALLAAKLNNDYSWIDYKKLIKYLDYYRNNQYDEISGLFFYIDDVMVGMDNNPTVFGRPFSSSADIFLNSSIVDEYNSLIVILDELKVKNKRFIKERDELIEAINRECYDKKDNMYYSQDLLVKTNKTEIFNTGLNAFWHTMPLKIEHIGCYSPVFYGFVNKDKALKILARLKGDGMYSEYGIRSLSKYEKMYNLTPSGNPSNWLGAVWGIDNFIAFKSFLEYGLIEDAKDIYSKTVSLFSRSIKEKGSMFESYNPENGEGILHDMFFSWNMLVGSMKRILEKQ